MTAFITAHPWDFTFIVIAIIVGSIVYGGFGGGDKGRPA